MLYWIQTRAAGLKLNASVTVFERYGFEMSSIITSFSQWEATSMMYSSSVMFPRMVPHEATDRHNHNVARLSMLLESKPSYNRTVVYIVNKYF